MDYNNYEMKIREKALCFIAAAAVIYCIAFIFYRSHLISGIVSMSGLLYPAIKKREIIEKRKRELNLQFKDLLYTVSSSLSSGKSVEMAFYNLPKDLEILYPEETAMIRQETALIIKRLKMNDPIEKALADFADRSAVEDIKSFTDVFKTCKRAGGNIVEVIKNTTQIISDRIEVRQEIEMLVAEKKFEQKILNIVPVAMILLLSASAPEYIEPIFKTLAGRVVMTLSLVLLLCAYVISKKIVDIKI